MMREWLADFLYTQSVVFRRGDSISITVAFFMTTRILVGIFWLICHLLGVSCNNSMIVSCIAAFAAVFPLFFINRTYWRIIERRSKVTKRGILLFILFEAIFICTAILFAESCLS